MRAEDEGRAMQIACDLLHCLGVTANYKGYYYAAYAARLCAGRPELLLLITKWLYPEVAEQYGTTWKAVERNIRTVASVAWKQNPELLSQLAGYPLVRRPQPGRFLSILAVALRSELERDQEFRVEK